MVFEPTHLKHLRTSNWIISPGKGENKRNNLKPPSSVFFENGPFSLKEEMVLKNHRIEEASVSIRGSSGQLFGWKSHDGRHGI